ncbi:MAG: metallophosphoesterase [Clostridia bacterium]|nr:metallophosphoesterase [Clostridia bacterium]
MKKIISVFLALIMIFSTVAISVSAQEEKTLKVTVANDLHYSATGNAVADKKLYDNYSNCVGTGQLRLECDLIIDEFLSRATGDVILIPGDITDNGLDAEHAYMAAKFAAFEAVTGKQVYVIPGNHDFYTSRGGDFTPAEFKALYAFAYSDAIAVDDVTASYVADINDEYRILAIDATKPGANQNLDERLYSWIEAQLKAAKAEGKKVIAMSHYNLMEHLILMDKLHKGSVLTSSMNLPELFAQYNVKVTFTGHSHEHDIKAYTGSNGNTIYDAVTTSINAYPCSYREVTFGDSIKFETKFVDKIDTALLEDNLSAEIYKQATEDFLAYAYELYRVGVVDLVESVADADTIIDMAGLDRQEDAELCELIDSVITRAVEIIYMPIYKADETEEGKSVESILKELKISLPETEFATIKDLAIDVYISHVAGDESCGVLDEKFTLITSCFTAIFNYALSAVTAEQYAQVMSLACSLFGAEIPVDFFKYAGTGLKKAQGIEIFITAVLTPVLLSVTTDEGTADNNVTLEGYGSEYEAEGELSLFDKIIKFFKDIFMYILRALGF